MDSTSKVLLFFIFCIAGGLGVGALISRAQMIPSSTPKNTPPIVVSDDQSSNNPVVSQNTDQTQTSIVSPIAENVSSETETSVITSPKPIFKCPVAPENESDQWLAPVGPDYAVGDDYVPDHLIPVSDYVPTVSNTMCLNVFAALHLQVMETAMHAQNLSVLVSSAYRPASYQANLRETEEAARNPVTNPYPSVALPGHSEHQLGTTVDLVTAHGNDPYTLNDFGNTAEYAWLAQHSWEYGFIQSYQTGKESITGYIAEPWHFRYVGVDNAIAIHNEQTTTYQYLKNLLIQQKASLQK